MSRVLERAFELHGQIRERLTALQNLAADLEDQALSVAVNGALVANTSGIRRTNQLLQETKTTDALEADLESQHFEGAS